MNKEKIGKVKVDKMKVAHIFMDRGNEKATDALRATVALIFSVRARASISRVFSPVRKEIFDECRGYGHRACGTVRNMI